MKYYFGIFLFCYFYLFSITPNLFAADHPSDFTQDFKPIRPISSGHREVYHPISDLQGLVRSGTPAYDDITVWFAKYSGQASKFNYRELIESASLLSTLKRRCTFEIPVEFERGWLDGFILETQAANTRKLGNWIHPIAHASFSLFGGKFAFKVLKAWQKEALRKIDNFDTHSLIESLHAFSTLGIQICPNFALAWQKQAEKQIRHFGPTDLRHSIYNLAMLGTEIYPPFWEAWQERTHFQIDRLTKQDIANILFSFFVMNKIPKNLADFLNKTNDLIYKLTPEEKHQLYLFAIYLGRTPPEQVSKVLRDFKDFTKDHPTFHTSHLQTHVFSVIKRHFSSVFPDLSEEVWIPQSCSRVDIASQARKLIVQVDGPEHYLISYRDGERNQLRPKDRAKDKLLMHFGWEIHRVSFIEWNKVRDYPRKSKLYLEKVLHVNCPG